MECSIHLQKNLLRQILGLIASRRETVSQIVDSRVPVPNNHFPGLAVPVPALRYQFGIGGVQRSSSASTTE
jgi:hypothetical protein